MIEGRQLLCGLERCCRKDVMPKPAQHIRFCKARDGAQIDMASLGRGPPLLRAAQWLSHVEHDARSQVWTHWLDAMSRDHTFIRYDQRGCGLSDRSPPSTSFEAWVNDLKAVVEAHGLKQFPLFAMSQGGAIAIAYAARHPEKVSHLILFGAYGKGALRRDITQQQRDEAETLVKLIRLGWGRDATAVPMSRRCARGKLRCRRKTLRPGWRCTSNRRRN